MNAIRNFFVRSPHWQVFAVLIGMLCIGQVLVVFTYPKAEGVEIPVTSLIVAELCWICFVLWFWSLGSFLNGVIQTDLRPKLRFFRFGLVYPLLYMAVFLITFEKLIPAYMIGILPFHLLALFCVFFDLNLVSKSLALAEMGRPVSFYDYAGPFFLLWFFPFGIWFVQPRINRIYAATFPANCTDPSLLSG
jgi:hypothetical protein